MLALTVNWNSINFWLGLIVTCGFLFGMVWGSIKGVQGFLAWWHKRLAATIAGDLQLIKKETQPNGGSSMRDAINRIEANQTRMEYKLDGAITDMQDQRSSLQHHLGQHEGL